MIKITKETELKKGMKIKFHNSIYEIGGFGKMPKFMHCLERDTIRLDYQDESDMHYALVTRGFLIDSNAEIIEGVKSNNKVIVSAEVADLIIEINHKDMFIERNKLNLYATAHEVVAEKNIELRSKFFNDNEITEDEFLEALWTKEFTIKRWRAKKGGKYFYTNHIYGIGFSFEHDCMEDCERYDLGNYFETKEEAEAKAKQIRAVLRGEE